VAALLSVRWLWWILLAWGFKNITPTVTKPQKDAEMYFQDATLASLWGFLFGN
jgi:hypothetical protein